ncbi:MAG: hypothetical protein OXK79_01550 [Chloroflexota bacterium]|nr:hypothetical protein [Spirochaetaceae bacterium]MDE2822176.1 hypothetical protein [Chloroflexota bacterium]
MNVESILTAVAPVGPWIAVAGLLVKLCNIFLKWRRRKEERLPTVQAILEAVNSALASTATAAAVGALIYIAPTVATIHNIFAEVDLSGVEERLSEIERAVDSIYAPRSDLVDIKERLGEIDDRTTATDLSVFSMQAKNNARDGVLSGISSQLRELDDAVGWIVRRFVRADEREAVLYQADANRAFALANLRAIAESEQNPFADYHQALGRHYADIMWEFGREPRYDDFTREPVLEMKAMDPPPR